MRVQRTTKNLCELSVPVLAFAKSCDWMMDLQVHRLYQVHLPWRSLHLLKNIRDDFPVPRPSSPSAKARINLKMASIRVKAMILSGITIGGRQQSHFVEIKRTPTTPILTATSSCKLCHSGWKRWTFRGHLFLLVWMLCKQVMLRSDNHFLNSPSVLRIYWQPP